MKRLVFALLLLLWPVVALLGGGPQAVDAGRSRVDRRAGRDGPADPHRVGARRQDAHHQRRADHRRSDYDEVRCHAGKAGARHRSANDPGLHGAAARDAGCRCVALRPHPDHGDDDRGRAAAAAAAGIRSRHADAGMPVCTVAPRADANGHAAAAQSARSLSRPGCCPSPTNAADQLDDPAIAAAAAAGLVPIPAFNPGSLGCACAADAARRRDATEAGSDRAGSGSADKSVERAGRYRAAESRAAAAGRCSRRRRRACVRRRPTDKLSVAIQFRQAPRSDETAHNNA